LICLYLYQYLSLWNASYIVGNGLMSTSQRKFNHVNSFSHSWDISQQSFYSYWWPDISIICCHFCTSHTYVDSPHFGLSSTTWFVKIGPLVVEIQAEWSLWQFSIEPVFPKGTQVRVSLIVTLIVRAFKRVETRFHLFCFKSRRIDLEV